MSESCRRSRWYRGHAGEWHASCVNRSYHVGKLHRGLVAAVRPPAGRRRHVPRRDRRARFELHRAVRRRHVAGARGAAGSGGARPRCRGQVIRLRLDEGFGDVPMLLITEPAGASSGAAPRARWCRTTWRGRSPSPRSRCARDLVRIKRTRDVLRAARAQRGDGSGAARARGAASAARRWRRLAAALARGANAIGSSRTKTAFVRTIGHELAAPLAALREALPRLGVGTPPARRGGVASADWIAELCTARWSTPRRRGRVTEGDDDGLGRARRRCLGRSGDGGGWDVPRKDLAPGGACHAACSPRALGIGRALRLREDRFRRVGARGAVGQRGVIDDPVRVEQVEVVEIELLAARGQDEDRRDVRVLPHGLHHLARDVERRVREEVHHRRARDRGGARISRSVDSSAKTRAGLRPRSPLKASRYAVGSWPLRARCSS